MVKDLIGGEADDLLVPLQVSLNIFKKGKIMNKYLAILIVVCTTCVEAKVLYHDKNGVLVEYLCTDTGKYTYCDLSPEKDVHYTEKKIKIWKVTLKITNGASKKINLAAMRATWSPL